MLRLVDANLDRLSEGLRVLEDIARFILNDADIAEKLKVMRHTFASDDPDLEERLIAARDSGNDVGHKATTASPTVRRRDLPDLVTANAKRAEQSLRLLEEFAKLPQMHKFLRDKNFEQGRFSLYEIEKDIILRLRRQEKRDKISGLYAIIDTKTLAGRSEADIARQVIDGGARVIQLRDKHRIKRDLLEIAQDLRSICHKADTLFIINDHVDVALAVDADGVHLGQTDIPISAVRHILPPGKIIGSSVHTNAKAMEAQDEGADYLGVGAIYPTITKLDTEVIGLAELRRIRESISLPIVALGGINEKNLDDVLKCGIESFAVAGAILNTQDVRSAAYQLAAIWEKNKQ